MILVRYLFCNNAFHLDRVPVLSCCYFARRSLGISKLGALKKAVNDDCLTVMVDVSAYFIVLKLRSSVLNCRPFIMCFQVSHRCKTCCEVLKLVMVKVWFEAQAAFIHTSQICCFVFQWNAPFVKVCRTRMTLTWTSLLKYGYVAQHLKTAFIRRNKIELQQQHWSISLSFLFLICSKLQT